MEPNNINTDLNQYTIEDIISLLNIDIDKLESYDEIKKSIDDNIEKYLNIFTESNNKDLIIFFKKLKVKFSNDSNNITESEKLVLNDNTYNVNRKQVSKLLTIDSRFRKNYTSTTSTEYTIDLPYIINNVIELKLSDAEFPTTFYPFNDEHENNYFWVKYTYQSAYAVTDTLYYGYVYIYIPPSNYYYQTVIDNINTTFSDAGLPIAMSFDLDFNNAGGVPNGTGKATFKVEDSSNSTITISELELNFKSAKIPSTHENHNASHIVSESDSDFIYYTENNTVDYKTRCGWMFGYRKPYYSGSTSYTSEGLLEILGPRYLYFVLEDFNTSVNVNFFTNNEETLLNSNVLGRISLKGSSFSIQSQTDFSIYTQPRFYYGPVNIDKLKVIVIDEYGRLVNLNGADWAFTISLTVIYDNK
tara:strand:+ start:17 stop:1264 length:1248 start_codon:yes stop_codon:yes gene_type:complete